MLVEARRACDTCTMDLEYRATEQFAEHMEAISNIAPRLTARLSAAAERLVLAFVQGGKVLCSGADAGTLLARHFAELMLHCFDRDRLALPAMAVAPIEAHCEPESSTAALSRQLAALSRPGDVLLLISTGSGEELRLALAAAHEREMDTIILMGDHQGALSALLEPADILIAVPAQNKARVLEVQLTSLHILCDLIDTQLLGSP